MDKKKKLHENVFHKSEEIDGTNIKGYDFNLGVDYEKILDTYLSTGFQASHFAKAEKILDKMIKEDVFIYLGFTSNLGTSGLRDIFRYLIERKKINLVVTTAGAIEEDIMKCFGEFILGDFKADGKELRKKGVNRTGNIFVPNERYIKLEKFLSPILEEISNSKKFKGRITPSEFVWILGEKINDKKSFCYWAWKNKIRVFCPALTDGAIGDNIYFFKLNGKEIIIDIAQDIVSMNDSAYGLKKSGLILLGSGVSKHHILNTNMLRNGADYSIYINNSQEFDGSDAGAMPEEAISWGKILPSAESVKIFADATLIFPLLVARTFAKR